MENKLKTVKGFRSNVEGFKSEYVKDGIGYISRLCQEYGGLMHNAKPLELALTNILRFDFSGQPWEQWSN